MDTRKIDVASFIRLLQELDKGYFTTSDLEKITGLYRDSLKVALHRFVAKGILTRIKRGVYQLAFSQIDVPKIANQLYYPSYLSFETALSLYGILSQIPYTQTFATTKKSKKIILWNTEVEYRQVQKELYFGYKLEHGIYIAEPEKALLDELYMVSRGKARLDIEELDLRDINKNKLLEYSRRFPRYVEKHLSLVIKYIGTTAVTLETKERITWNKTKQSSL